MAATAATLSEQAQELPQAMGFFQLASARGSDDGTSVTATASPSMAPRRPRVANGGERRQPPAQTGNGVVPEEISMDDFKQY